MLRRKTDLPVSDLEPMPTDEADVIVPPVPVAAIDQVLSELRRGAKLVSRDRVIDMLLDVRLALWAPSDESMAVSKLLDAVMPAGK